MGLLKRQVVYLFQLDFLLQFQQWPQSALENTEQLEQLRILENGETLLCVEAKNDGVGVDVPLDVEYAEMMLKRKNSKKYRIEIKKVIIE